MSGVRLSDSDNYHNGVDDSDDDKDDNERRR